MRAGVAAPVGAGSALGFLGRGLENHAPGGERLERASPPVSGPLLVPGQTTVFPQSWLQICRGK